MISAKTLLISVLPQNVCNFCKHFCVLSRMQHRLSAMYVCTYIVDHYTVLNSIILLPTRAIYRSKAHANTSHMAQFLLYHLRLADIAGKLIVAMKMKHCITTVPTNPIRHSGPTDTGVVHCNLIRVHFTMLNQPNITTRDLVLPPKLIVAMEVEHCITTVPTKPIWHWGPSVS